MNSILLAIELLALVGKLVPTLAPAIKNIFDMIKGMDVPDITHDELVVRVDAAQAKLEEWK